MADDDKLDEIIYTITTGFYPQLFAGKGPTFGSGSKFVQGKGKVGAKSAQVKGWAGKKSFVIEKGKAKVREDLVDDPAAEKFFEDTKGGTFKDMSKRKSGRKKDSFRVRWNKADEPLRGKLLQGTQKSGGAWKDKINLDDTSDLAATGPLRGSQKEMEEHLTYTKFKSLQKILP